MPPIQPVRGALASRNGIASLIWLLSEKLLQLAFAAISIGLIARTLGVDQFGEFQYALSVLFVCSALGLLANSETAAPKLIEQNTAEKRRVFLGSLFLLRLSAGALAATVMILWALAVEPSSRQAMLYLLAFSLLVSEPFNIFRLICETEQNTRIITTTRLVVSIAKILIIGALYLLKAPIIAFILVYSADYFAVAIIYLLSIRNDGLPWQWKISPQWIQWLIKNGAMVWLGVLSLILIQRLDRVILEARLPTNIYSHYTAAMSLLDSAWFFGPITIAALAPSMVYRLEAKQIHIAPRRFLPLLLLIGIVIAAGIGICSPLFIPLIFGADFSPAAAMLQLSALTLIPGFGALALNAILIKAGQHRAVTMQWVCGLSVFLLCLLPSLPLSWKQGPFAIGAGYLSCLLVGLWMLRRYLNSSKKTP